MAKNSRTILIHFCLQVLAGGIVLLIASSYFDGPLGGVGLIGTYFVTAFASILVSFLILSTSYKLPREEKFKSVILNTVFWTMVPFIFSIANRSSSGWQDDPEMKKKSEAIEKVTLDAARQMGLTSYTWSPAIWRCIMKTNDGKEHSFYLQPDDKTLYVACKVTLPPFNDTLAWLRLSLDHASVYLNSLAIRRLDSCINTRNYTFKVGNDPDSEFEIVIYPMNVINNHLGINAKLCFERSYGNLCLRLGYNQHLKNIYKNKY
jgi:hypothetical protein